MIKNLPNIALFIALGLLWFFVDSFFDEGYYAFEESRVMLLRVDLERVNKEKTGEFYRSGLDIALVRTDASVEIIATPEEYRQLVSERYNVEVLVSDLYKQLVSRYGRATGLGFPGGYHSYKEMVQELFDIQSDHPGITQLQVIGSSIEDRDIYAMKVSDNADIDEDEPEVLFTGLHHAREPVTLEICLDLLNTLTDNYGSNPHITSLVDEREVWVIPLVNPDGYEYAQNVDPYWRKNRRDNGDGSFGVDNNRNYGYAWGWDDHGSGYDPRDPTYRGPAPFSEPENQAIRDFTEARDFCITLSHHAYGNEIIYPWGFVYGPTDDQQALEGMGNALSFFHNYDDGRISSIIGKVNGEFTDWQYGDTSGKSSNLSFTIETGDEFYPPSHEIPQLVEEGRDHNLYILTVADAPYRFAPPPPQRITPIPIDDDGSFTVTWDCPNQGKRDLAVRYELQELTDETIITDDLENGTPNWDMDGFTLSGTRSHSGSYSFYSGTGDLRTSTATIVTDHKARMRDVLTFWTWYEIEDGWDYAYVEISTDGGLTFQSLPGDITTNDNPNGNNEGNGIGGSSNGWILAHFNLSRYLGDHVNIRFRYTTDRDTYESGFYVDDVALVTTYGSITTLSSNILDTFYEVSGRDAGKYFYRVIGVDGDDHWSNWSPIEAAWVSSYPYISVSLSPDSDEVEQGGSLGYSFTITNESADQEAFEVWIDIDLPGGSPLPSNPFMGPLELNMPSGGSVSRHMDVHIPESAPIGDSWTFNMRSGNHPAGIVAEDSFQFDIISSPGVR
jgi:carboxypeptidase T